MKNLGIAIALVALLVAPVRALTPKERAYLRKIGIDPKSADVAAAEAAGTIEVMFHHDRQKFSLSSLITRRDSPNAVRRFIVTRAFIARLKKDFDGTAMPEKDYDPDFLTDEERDLVIKKLDSTR